MLSFLGMVTILFSAVRGPLLFPDDYYYYYYYYYFEGEEGLM